jgi:hypothetical protein
MSTKMFKRMREEDAVWELGYRFLDREEMLIYNEDPDLFMAREYGFDTARGLAEYYDSGGAALCGGTTKKGKPCQALIKCCSDPADFRRVHRQGRCYAHKEQPAHQRQANRFLQDNAVKGTCYRCYRSLCPTRPKVMPMKWALLPVLPVLPVFAYTAS